MISPTLSKQEIDIINKLIDQLSYSENPERVELTLEQFEGKHFRHLSQEDLLKRIKEMTIKLNNLKLINAYKLDNNKIITKDFLLSFDIKDKVASLEQYKEELENEVARVEFTN